MDTGRSATCELLGARCVCEFPASNSAPPGGGDWERVPACVAARRGRVAAPGLRVQQGLSASTLTGGWVHLSRLWGSGGRDLATPWWHVLWATRVAGQSEAVFRWDSGVFLLHIKPPSEIGARQKVPFPIFLLLGFWGFFLYLFKTNQSGFSRAPKNH